MLCHLVLPSQQPLETTPSFCLINSHFLQSVLPLIFEGRVLIEISSLASLNNAFVWVSAPVRTPNNERCRVSTDHHLWSCKTSHGGTGWHLVELLVEKVLGDAETTQTNVRTECLSLKTDSRGPLEIKIFTCSLDVERLRWCRIGLSLLWHEKALCRLRKEKCVHQPRCKILHLQSVLPSRSPGAMETEFVGVEN